MNKAVFLDRDGVINRALIKNGKPIPPHSLAEFELLPKVAEALRMLQLNKFYRIVVTNQPDVGDKTQSKEVVESFHSLLFQQLALDHIEVCYERDSFRYKPNPGMLIEAAKKYQIAFNKSYMIGDRWRDIEAGKAVGCYTILIESNYQEELKSKPDVRVSSLYEAALHILSISNPSERKT